MTTTATAVTPGHEPERKERGRTIELEWEIGERNRDGTDDIVTQFAVLSCSHDRERKVFYATLLVAEDEDRGGHTSRAYRPFDSLAVCTKRVARFSAKRLEEFADQAREILLANADDPRVLAKFRGEHEMPNPRRLD